MRVACLLAAAGLLATAPGFAQTLTDPAGLYRAVQGHGTNTARVIIERNIAESAAIFGVSDFDNNVAGDGWAMVGRTNGAGGNGTLSVFFLDGTLDPDAIGSLVPRVRILQGTVSGPRCVETSPLANALGLSPVKIGQTRLMEPVELRAPGACSPNGILGTATLGAFLNDDPGQFPLGSPTVEMNAPAAGGGQFTIRYPKDSVNAARAGGVVRGTFTCLAGYGAQVQLGGQVTQSNLPAWPVGSFVRFGVQTGLGGSGGLNYTAGEAGVPTCAAGSMTADLPLKSGAYGFRP